MGKKQSWHSEPEKMWADFEKVIRDETPRGQILIHGAMIEDGLTRLLLAYFKESDATEELFKGFNSPLGNWSAKIHMAAALGLVNDHEYRALNLLRELRNHAAHQMTPPLDQQTFIDRLERLHRRLNEGHRFEETKNHYMMLVSYLGATIFGRINLVGDEPDQMPRLGSQVWVNTRTLFDIE